MRLTVLILVRCAGSERLRFLFLSLLDNGAAVIVMRRGSMDSTAGVPSAWLLWRCARKSLSRSTHRAPLLDATRKGEREAIEAFKVASDPRKVCAACTAVYGSFLSECQRSTSFTFGSCFVPSSRMFVYLSPRMLDNQTQLQASNLCQGTQLVRKPGLEFALILVSMLRLLQHCWELAQVAKANHR